MSLNYLEIVFLVIILVFGVIGLFRGLVKGVLGLVLSVITIILVIFLTPIVSKAIIDNTNISDKVYEKTMQKVESYIDEKVMPETTDTIKRQEALDNMTRADEIKMIDDMQIPESVKKALQDNNNKDVYELLGVNNVFEYVAKSFTYMMVNAITAGLLFIIIRLIFGVIEHFIYKMTDELPMVNGLNKIGGLIAGLGIGLIVVWIVYTIMGYIMPDKIEALTEGSKYLGFLNDKNFIQHLITNITKSSSGE